MLFYRESAPQTKIEHVLCAISKLSTPFFEKSYKHPQENFRNNSEISVGYAVFELLMKGAK